MTFNDSSNTRASFRTLLKTFYTVILFQYFNEKILFKQQLCGFVFYICSIF